MKRVVIIGAGVVGLAVARELALSRRYSRVTLIERTDLTLAKNAGTSRSGSGVVHAGLHHKLGSYKAALCKNGRDRLEGYAMVRGIPYRRIGKLIVAQAGEEEELAAIQARAAEIGVPLEPLDARGIADISWQITAKTALWSPLTGIIDVTRLLLALLDDCRKLGVQLLDKSEFLGAAVMPNGYQVVQSGYQPMMTDVIVNAAGPDAVTTATKIEGGRKTMLPAARFVRGEYYAYPTKFPVLVYPVPVKDGLGIHATMDTVGKLRFGPSVEEGNSDRAQSAEPPAEFVDAIRRYFPSIDPGKMTPAGVGIRPKITGDNDFIVDTDMPGVINLFGIDSPGLTAALAIGTIVDEMISQAV